MNITEHISFSEGIYHLDVEVEKRESGFQVTISTKIEDKSQNFTLNDEQAIILYRFLGSALFRSGTR